ncbi:uncharacterized protein [Physcomitrium patens]|uniref:Uncharacterized protein n=1 Tax=Physcomitrium patens TaxID=3218 RepID=A9TUC5_PHYPA|nr:uncharacterized protein LOC112274973 [Physcomitrium patens]PNR30781.1 hypothetical protein PHYPA_027097 [Physcomitrium patens]|eukprot:XP_024360636.1 uncharacterized protein LOC112274973 [Physcomitrella patens]
MAIVRAGRHLLARATGKQANASGRPVRMIRPVRLKREEPPLPVQAPFTQEIFDTPNIKMAVGMVLAVVLAKLTMMYDESLEPERIERQAREFAEVQANLKPLSRDEWEEIQELRPRTPFESKIGRSHSRIRTGEVLSLEDIKDWAFDVLMEAMMRKEETVQRSLEQ